MNKTPRNHNLIHNAQNLRKSLTKEERHLWYDFLRSLPLHFSRQKVIGHYIADFYCAKARLVIELDGSQHFEEDNIEYDKQRTDYFTSIGIAVLRYSNLDINTKFDCVCEDIFNKLKLNMD